MGLARLNLVYGENNAGKSAVVRIPPLLAASRTPGRAGLDLGGPVRGAGFREVQWRGPLGDEEDPDLILGLGLSNGANWRWTFRWVDSSARAVIQQAEFRSGDEVVVLSEGTKFDGLVPRMGAAPAVDAGREDLARVLDQVLWLEAKREAPSREGIPRGASGAFSSTGDGAAARVAAEAGLRGAVSAWFRSHVQCTVEVESLGSDLQRLVLQPLGTAFAVPFPDAGEGLQQVFAVVTALELVRLSGGMLCIEEPESHLHPRLQQALATLAIDVLFTQPDASVLVETHSEVFLLAALTAAATRLRGDVQLYWIESTADASATVSGIPLDQDGRPLTTQLEHAFNTMGVMRRELISARKQRESGD